MDGQYFEAHARDVNLEDVTSSEYNAVILEMLREDECRGIGILGDDYDWADENDFVVRDGDNLGWLGYFIGKSKRLESLWISHLSGDKSLVQGLAQNESIQKLYIYTDLGKPGFQSLAPFFRNTNTLREIDFSGADISRLESAKNIAFLLNQCQIRSLKKLVLEDNNLSGEGFEEIARSLRAQPQLEELNLYGISSDDEDAPFDQRGYAAIGAAMKHWTLPSLKKLVVYLSDLDNDGLLALVKGMANCVNLEHLDLSRNGSITAVGLKALSSLFQSKIFCLRSLDMSEVGVNNEGMITLASGLAAIQSLESLNLSNNAISDEGLQALAVGLSNNKNLESLNLSRNGGSFSAIGLRCLSDVIPTALNLREVNLEGNSINDECLQALAVGLRKHCTLERLDLTSNAIGSEGLRALAAAEITSLRWLSLANNDFNDEAWKALAEVVESLCNMEALNLSRNRITTSGLEVLSRIFKNKSCSLKEIDLYPTNIEDIGAKAFAEGLAGNESLTKILFDYTDVTALGWSAFSTLLCDTSSVNNTYLSNHTLEAIGCRYSLYGIPSSIQTNLELNRQNEYDVPICKILMSHSNLDMTPFLQWKLKLLPFVVAWFERARRCRVYSGESVTSFKRREFSALYQFINGLPLLAASGASGFYKQMGAEAHSKKRKYDLCVK